jgi:hypothetical protein
MKRLLHIIASPREGGSRTLQVSKVFLNAFKEDGSLEVDTTIDASLYGIFAFGAYPAYDEKVKNTMDQA